MPLSLYHSSAGDSLFKYSSKRLIFWSSAIVPLVRKAHLIALRKSVGCFLSSCVPENLRTFSSCMKRDGLGDGGGEGNGVLTGVRGGEMLWFAVGKCCGMTRLQMENLGRCPQSVDFRWMV